ncbi:hypothetical protein [Lentilactobacillus farraginis]|uniref:Extracellular protein n=1 Tax=Lentilactobacillus farraginis DSM 18382 = JCM 14108 TaxID=1423743 RepID=X0PBV1_9LACO|nr:hypothetical protein [Lentilactobacillus farraginis]KRM03782.1 hypothetical protein FD41_GL001028 [Lentilactobacillus farraginis DSM 18382 = JCM 14108]GAF37789.1 extracellular protein [Lentilactobacillus farraginis DSM 18382 = JCM 14108]
MRTRLNPICLLLLAFVSLIFLTQTASADVIDAPDPANDIPQVNAGNVLTDYTQKDLNVIDNQTPKGNMDRKYDERIIDEDHPGTVESYQTTPDSTLQTSLQTKLYLPDGFNVTNYQHGNFQSVTLDDSGNIYFIESNGSDTNLGVIVKYNLAELNKLGAGSDPMLVWNAFNYFNPYTPDGISHNQQYEAIYDQLKAPQADLKQAKSQANQLQTTIGQKNGTKADRKKLAALDNQIDTDQKQIKSVKQQNADLFKYAAVAQAAQLSPQVDIGHGQTLSFNPQNKHLYIVEDNTLTDLKNRDQDNSVLEMTADTLKPLRQYNFKMYHGKTANLQLHTLTFDKRGNAYWGRKNGLGYMFFYGRLDQHDVQFQAAPTYFKNRGGSPNQGVSYNPANDRLYYVTDDILTSIPTQAVRDGSFTANDMHYMAFTSKRECESLTFDQQGYGYQLMLWPAEILKSSTPLN